MLVRLELNGPSSEPMGWAPVCPKCTDTFGVQSDAEGCAPGTSPGAAAKCYDQVRALHPAGLVACSW